MTSFEQLKMHSPNLVEANIDKIASLFPNCITEAQDEHGIVKKAIDFDLLRQELSHVLVEGDQERYRLDWPGKKEAILTANAPIAKTLRPCREESVNFDTTQNLFIEGDNLDALKLLQENYLGKVKMIYIDPPYNTGNDFIYNDNFAESTEEFFEKSQQIDEEGNRLVANTESNGRFHSDWLSMMYSRLKLASNLLKNDGVIFISIGDDEQASLKKACDEIFGINNFLGCACRVSKKANNQGEYWSPNFDYILTYAKNRSLCPPFFGGVNYAAYDQVDTEGPRAGEYYQLVRLYMTSLDPMRGCTNQRYYIQAPDGTLLIPPGNVFPVEKIDGESIPPKTGEDKVWRWGRETYLKEKDRIVIKRVRSSNLVDENGSEVKWNVFTKTYLNDVIANTTAKPNSLIENHINQNSSHELNILEIPFSFAKPSSLIKYLCEISRIGPNDIVMDFFAGSSTTAHAIMDLNAEHSTNRKFILIQLPEQLNINDKNSKAGLFFCEKNGFKNNIAEISKERIRRAGQKILADNADKQGIEKLDIGFRVLKVDSSNMKDVYYTPDSLKKANLDFFESNIKEERTDEDLLFQVMLDWGLELSLPIEPKQIADKTVYFVAGNSLVACFQPLSMELIDQIAQQRPLRFISAERAIVHDQDKTNIRERFKQLSPETDVRFL